MKRALSQFSVAAVLAATVLSGCNKEETKPTPPTGGPSTRPSAATKPAATKPSTLPVTGSGVVNPIVPVTGNIPKTDPAKIGVPKPVDPSAAATDADVQGRLDEVSQSITDKKFDLAETALKKLEENKPLLSPSMQGKLAAARKALDAAKAGTGAAPELQNK